MLKSDIQSVEDIELDEPIACKPHSVDCDQEADAWWMASCCGKKYPFCWEHELLSDIESGDLMMVCVICGASNANITWTRFPIR